MSYVQEICCCTLRRSVSLHFRTEVGSSGQLWCHQLCWRAFLAGDGARNFWASVNEWTCACSALGSKIIMTTIEGLRQVLVELLSARFICSWQVLKYCVKLKTIPETGSCMFLRDCSLRWSRRWLLRPRALSLRCHHCRSQQQMCSCLNWSKIYVGFSTVRCFNIWGSCPKSCKIWPKLDLAWMPDLPEPEPKSGTSLLYRPTFTSG